MTLAKRIWAARPENAYRDVWMLGLTVLLVLALNAQANQTDQIQRSRHDAIVRACGEQNRRNTVALRFLSALPPTEGQPHMDAKVRARLVRQFTDALVGPVENCERKARQATS